MYTCIKCVLWHAIRLIVIKVQHGGFIMAMKWGGGGGGGGGGEETWSPSCLVWIKRVG